MTHNVKAVTVYTDASPTTGEELQGMVVEIYTRRPNPAMRREILPGSTLSYGHYNAVAKTVVLLYGLWLMGGPLYCDIAWLISVVYGVCTDFGTEQHTVEVPDIVRSLLAWMSGKPLAECRTLINFDRRLLWRALRVGGWGHAVGNLMKNLCEKDPLWTRYRPRLQDICSLMRNKTWRSNIKRRLPPGVPEPERLDHFSASLAVWRYETADEVLMAIHRIRDILENNVSMEIFASPKDRETIRGAVLGCQEKGLHTYVARVGNDVIHPTEGSRRWGMVCPCPEHVRMRHEGAKHVDCIYHGKRLRDAWKHILNEIETAKTTRQTLTLEACEGNQEVHRSVRSMLSRKISGLKLRFTYFSLIPWFFQQC